MEELRFDLDNFHHFPTVGELKRDEIFEIGNFHWEGRKNIGNFEHMVKTSKKGKFEKMAETSQQKVQRPTKMKLLAIKSVDPVELKPEVWEKIPNKLLQRVVLRIERLDRLVAFRVVRKSCNVFITNPPLDIDHPIHHCAELADCRHCFAGVRKKSNPTLFHAGFKRLTSPKPQRRMSPCFV